MVDPKDDIFALYQADPKTLTDEDYVRIIEGLRTMRPKIGLAPAPKTKAKAKSAPLAEGLDLTGL